jgi:hypothetical protein
MKREREGEWGTQSDQLAKNAHPCSLRAASKFVSLQMVPLQCWLSKLKHPFFSLRWHQHSRGKQGFRPLGAYSRANPPLYDILRAI